MFPYASRRVTALVAAMLFSGAMALPLALCLCAPVAQHHGCGNMEGGATSLSTCCCDSADAVPAAPTASATAGIATNALAFVFSPMAAALVHHSWAATAVGTAPPLTRSRPLFKLFSAFLI